MAHQCTEEIFLNDVKDHQMTVFRDDGTDRRIKFKQPGTSDGFFFLITWPGHLCITGDYGTYVFSRTDDMFEFFRCKNQDLRINPSYWGEKILSISRFEGFEKFSEETFKDAVKNHFDYHFEDCEDEQKKTKCWEAIEDEVLPYVSNEYEAYEYTGNFEFEDFRFEDFWEYSVKEYTSQYIWCLYAIVWGIQQYDEYDKKSQVAV